MPDAATSFSEPTPYDRRRANTRNSDASVTPGRINVPSGGAVRYGDDPPQFAILSLPSGRGPFPVIVFIHGGFWRNAYDLTLAEPQAADAVARGFAAWNIEYRRLGDPGGGYPGTFDDVSAAVDLLAELDAPLDLGRVVVVGHSAGGHLALWIGQRRNPDVIPKLVVGQAPVADFEATADLSGGAVVEFMGGTSEERPDAYAVADPLHLLPAKVPQLIVHGDSDVNVPVESVDAYVAAAGDGLVFRKFIATDHFDVIDPSHDSWQFVLSTIEESQ